MSKNISDQESFLRGFKKPIKTVVFGNGEIQCGTAKLDNGYHVAILADTERPHQIGKQIEPKKGEWFEEVSGDVVCLAFNNAGSVDVMIDFLNEIRASIGVQNEKGTLDE